ncbi:MAG TPA: peptidoglycan bridge formation glycyltransferase FemA/FemB family protein [Candidatus Paceibacterota bacterium]|nr:peptidoglycan bridge formation glycyltransferase FemA/FemB family protein [Candidatus Paceibacterota bacterium]
MAASFLNTPDWLAFQRALGRKVWRLDDGIMRANVIRHDIRLGKNYLYVPHGPELNLNASGAHNAVKRFHDRLMGLALEEQSVFVKLEPLQDAVMEQLYRNGFRPRPSRRYLQPQRTVVMDLSRSEDALLSAMHHKTRYNVLLARRKGVSVAEIGDADVFWNLLRRTGERDGFRTHPRAYYRELLSYFGREGSALRTRLYAAFANDRPLAAALVLEHGDAAYYLHGASDRQFRQLMAPHALHWDLILRYKKNGFASYDFWGVDARRMPGVTRFKLGWGGTVRERPGSFDRPLSSFWYFVYRHLPR